VVITTETYYTEPFYRFLSPYLSALIIDNFTRSDPATFYDSKSCTLFRKKKPITDLILTE